MRTAPWIAVVGLLSLACSESASSDSDGGSAGNAGTAGVVAGWSGASNGAAGAGAGGASGGAAGSGNAGEGAGGQGGAGGTAGMSAAGGSASGAGGAQGGGGGAGAVAGEASGGAGLAGAAGNAGESGGAGMSGSAGTAGAAGGSGCDPALAQMNRELVGNAIDELFIEKDVSAIDRYWSDPYLQHNPIAMSGVSTFRSIMSSFVTQPSFSYTRIRTLAECDLVVVQGRYSQTGVIFDMFRVDDGKIMEHWDSDSGQASETDGPTTITAGAPTADNRALVESFLAALIAGDVDRAPEFIGAAHTEHHGDGGNGPAAFTGFLEADGVSYVEVHHVIADGDFVFTMSEASVGGDDYALYDLFRVEGGAIVEHWDSRRVVPDSTASGLPIF